MKDINLRKVVSSLKRRIMIVPQAISIFKNWPVFLANYNGLIPKKNIIIELKNGVKYNIRAKTLDSEIINEIWLRKDYSPPGFEINENDVVVDIGAHIGIFSLFAADSAKKGKVYSYEPFPDNFKLLKNNVKINSCQNITIFRKAIAGKSGKKSLFVSESENTGTHSFYSNNKRTKSIEVSTESLSGILRNNNISNIDFLKIDCEGAEYELLFNCSSATLSKIKKISMEYHNIDNKNNLTALKKILGRQFSIKTIPFGPTNMRGMLYAQIKN